MHSTAAAGDPDLVRWGLNLLDGGGGATHDASAGPVSTYESRLGSRYAWVDPEPSPQTGSSRPEAAPQYSHGFASQQPAATTSSSPEFDPSYTYGSLAPQGGSERPSSSRLQPLSKHDDNPRFRASQRYGGNDVYGSVYGRASLRVPPPPRGGVTEAPGSVSPSQATMATPRRWESTTANDEVIAIALQEEFSHLATLEAEGKDTNLDVARDDFQGEFLAQDWTERQRRRGRNQGPGSHQSSTPVVGGDESGNSYEGLSGLVTSQSNNGYSGTSSAVGSTSAAAFQPNEDDDRRYALVLAEELGHQQEVAKRLTHMESIPHIPKINGLIPSLDAASEDHQRLLERLYLYGLSENKIQGDGNCQFRALSDQLYRTPEHHKVVRRTVVEQLKAHPETYESYVPMKYSEYVKRMAKSGEWGDHVTLQAAADHYGVKISLVTSFRDTCFVEITPCQSKSNRVIWLSFWAEVHYNSIYPQGDAPESVADVKKKKHWLFPF